MAKNYTPLNLSKLEGTKQKGAKTHAVLIIIAIFTAAVLAFILIVLIQRTTSSSSVGPQSPTPQPVETISPTVEEQNAATPSSATIELSPTSEIVTPSSTISPVPGK